MAKQKKLPAMQFYTGDWMKDLNLRKVSLAAKGIWIDMLCLMHESDRRGYLQCNGTPVTPEQLARMTGCSPEEASQCLEELESSGVFSRTKNGIIFSRRMKNDEEKRRKAIEYGRLGGNPELKGRVKGSDKLKQGSSSSVSTSVNNSLSSRAHAYPEIPEKLYSIAQNALGWMTPDKPLQSLLIDYPSDWIEEAAKEAALKGKTNASYVRGILHGYQRNGGPPKHDNACRNNGKSLAKNRGARGDGTAKFDGLDDWAKGNKDDEG